jgi:pyruvate kinase
MSTKTKIIATIGPASDKKTIIDNMIKNGMDIARINTKWAKPEETINLIQRLNQTKTKILIDINNKQNLNWIKNQNIHYLAISYAESKQQIQEIRKLLPKKIKIISKIETKKGLENIDNLIEASDGIMIARGDLGKNIPYERLPITQKLIIKKCNKKKVFVITATEMLMSITKAKTPERAEITDIANAVLDGSDALMLSEETAIGKYPSLAVKIMNKIIKELEKNRGLLI